MWVEGLKLWRCRGCGECWHTDFLRCTRHVRENEVCSMYLFLYTITSFTTHIWYLIYEADRYLGWILSPPPPWKRYAAASAHAVTVCRMCPTHVYSFNTVCIPPHRIAVTVLLSAVIGMAYTGGISILYAHRSSHIGNGMARQCQWLAECTHT